jgi:hypothetical protein
MKLHQAEPMADTGEVERAKFTTPASGSVAFHPLADTDDRVEFGTLLTLTVRK